LHFISACVNVMNHTTILPIMIPPIQPDTNNIETEKKPIKAVTETNDWSFREMLRFAIIAAVIVIPIRIFVAEPYLVRQTSMIPTFSNNDYLVVEKLSYRFISPSRGDIIVFRSPLESGKTLIKRIIGLPGETVIIENGQTSIKNGETVELDEPYVVHEASSFSGTFTLEEGEYFMMGDNRAGSYDSRAWGPIDRSDIIGRPIVRLYNFENIGFWPGQDVLPKDYLKNTPSW